MRVERIETPAALMALAEPWRNLARRAVTGNLFNDFDWLAAWWPAFGGGQLLTYAVWQGDTLVALAPMELRAAEDLGARVGRPARRLVGLFNHYLGRFDVLFENSEALRFLLRAIREDRDRWDVLELPQVPEDSPTLTLLEALDAQKTLAVRNICSPYLELQGSYQQWYENRHSSKKRYKDRRLIKLAEKIGRTEIVLHRAQEPVIAAFERGLQVEHKSWKGAQNSSIIARPQTAGFMREVVARYAERGEAVLYEITIGGQAAAFLIGFVQHGCFYLHKTGYDPEFQAASPGRIILLRSIELAYQLGLSRYDFLGAPDEYKLHYTATVRPHLITYVYHDGLRSRLAYWEKRQLIPLARQLMQQPEPFTLRVDR